VSSEVRPGESSAPSAATILVVDDRTDIGRLTQDILETAGYVVLPTSDPREALSLSRHTPGAIDLLLADVGMPLMDGRELAQRMIELHPDMKVMLMSGSHEVGTVETGWAFIEKPFTVKELLQRVAETLEARSPSRGSAKVGSHRGGPAPAVRAEPTPKLRAGD
jgi:two-component system, cell cycle sensor histidine kinase and response regulator CckA